MEQFEQIRLTVIIPVYRGGAYFKRCLASVLKEKRAGVEILVVVDGPGDGVWQEAECQDVRILKMRTNSGPATARNEGALAARGSLLFFVDVDVSLHSGTIQQILCFFDQNPEVDAAIGSYDDEPSASNFFSQYKNLLHHYVHQHSREEGSTFWGACGVIRRDKFLEIGGFDQTYRNPAIEDIELGYRLRRQGGRIRLIRSLQVTHMKEWTCHSLLRADIFCRAIPWTLLIWRDHGAVDDLNLQRSSRFSVLLTLLLFLSFFSSFFFPFALFFVLAAAVSLVFINRSLYAFFRKKHGNGFMLKCLPWHWFYFFYGGVAFAIGTVKFFLSAKSLAPMTLRQVPSKSEYLRKADS